MDTDLCECGWPHLDLEPDDYRRAVAAVTAYLHGEPELLAEIVGESGPGTLAALVEGAAVAIALLADESQRPRSAVLEDFGGFVAHHFGDQP